MFTARSGHGAYALDDGRVLVAGGGVDAAGTATAEVYNPPTNRWTPTGSMIFPRAFFSGVVLPDGRVLVAGGLGSPATSETYNPWTETWSLAGALNFPHGTGSSLTLLSNGQALILGGGGQAELFDPVTGVWTPTTPMPSTRSGHSATLLGNGLVFVTGHDPRSEPGASLVYDPLPQTWRWMAGNAPMFNLAVRLIDGRGRVPGGFRPVGQGALSRPKEAFVFDDSFVGRHPVQSAESPPSH